MAMQDSQSVATDETNTLISSDKVEGTAVYNREGEKLGSIHTLMIDKVSGRSPTRPGSFSLRASASAPTEP
jgi:hypothetical protein